MKTVYVDMDDVLADYAGAFRKDRAAVPELPWPQAKVGFFLRLKPLPGALESMRALYGICDLWILTAPSILNPASYTEKRLWVEDHLGMDFCKRLIISPDKSKLMGDFLVDDRATGKGQNGFRGELVLFGGDKFPDWPTTLSYLCSRISG